jgi:hypothetical protein
MISDRTFSTGLYSYQRRVPRNIFQSHWYTPNAVKVASYPHAETLRFETNGTVYKTGIGYGLLSPGHITDVVHVVCYRFKGRLTVRSNELRCKVNL